MPSGIELYGGNAYAKLRSGESSLSNIPLKQPDPWATRQELAPPAVPGTKYPVYGDNLAEASRELERQYPGVSTRPDRWEVLKKAMKQGMDYKLMPWEKRPVTQQKGRIELAVKTPQNVPFAVGNAIFFPPGAIRGSTQFDEFGTLAHELRHGIQERKAGEFEIGEDQKTLDSWGNQLDHFPLDYTDRMFANDLKRLKLFQETGRIPESVRKVSPWMAGKKNPNINHLMEYVGRVSAGKK